MTMDWITLALSLADQTLKKLPDYDQKKKQEYYKKKQAYNQEKSKSYPMRDDDLLLGLKEDLYAFAQAIHNEGEK